jgi:3-hexulose-6-phosphate synthase
MRLQLALDLDSVAAAAAVLEKTADLVDIVEVGTPLVLREGAKAIRALKEGFPDLVLLADFKIMDAGKEEAEIAFEAGADIVTVLAAAEITTIRRACEAARNAGREVMADLIAVSGVARRAMKVSAAGVSYLCCHTAFDIQSSGADPAREITEVRAALPSARVAAAGGITPQRIGLLLTLAPEIVIVGGFVTRAADPRAALQQIRAAMRGSGG